MATRSTPEEIERANAQTELEIKQKAEAQAAEGKSFIVAPDGHGPGVVPEDVWQGHKEQNNG